MSVFNGTGGDAEFEVRLETEGPVAIQGNATQTVRVPDGREGQVYFDVRAERTLGKATFTLTTEGGGQTTEDQCDIEAARKRRVNPVSARRVKPVAYWSGLVETDRRGRGSVTFDIPQFNGTSSASRSSTISW